MHLSMFSPRRKGGGRRGRCGAFDKTCPPESGEFDCLFTVFSLKSVGLVGCLFISERDFLEKGLSFFPKNPT